MAAPTPFAKRDGRDTRSDVMLQLSNPTFLFLQKGSVLVLPMLPPAMPCCTTPTSGLALVPIQPLIKAAHLKQQDANRAGKVTSFFPEKNPDSFLQFSSLLPGKGGERRQRQTLMLNCKKCFGWSLQLLRHQYKMQICKTLGFISSGVHEMSLFFME